MKILFVTPSYKPAYCYGGPTISVSELAEALVSLGHTVTVYTTTANGQVELDVSTGKANFINGVEVYYFRRITKDHTHTSPTLWLRLWKTIKHFDVVHLQSWWNLLVIGAAAICKLKETKYILSPRGMLGAYSFTNKHNFSKKILHHLVGKRLLKQSFLHATTPLEWNDCMQVNKDWRGFMAYNLINLPTDKSSSRIRNNVFTFGFLSRIDPKKGLELLFSSLACLTFNYKLRIAGSGEANYINSLKSLAGKLSISDKIEWCGWKDGVEKYQFIETLDLFVLTSYNENFAIVVAESLAIGTPVLVSDKVGLADYVQEKKLGYVCELNTSSIRHKLEFIYKRESELKTISETAPQIINVDFDKKNLAKQYIQAYQHIETS
mgnify:CR=1 FL=1